MPMFCGLRNAHVQRRAVSCSQAVLLLFTTEGSDAALLMKYLLCIWLKDPFFARIHLMSIFTCLHVLELTRSMQQDCHQIQTSWRSTSVCMYIMLDGLVGVAFDKAAI